MKDDEECAAESHSYLAELLETGHAAVLPVMGDALRVVALVKGGGDKNMGSLDLKERLARSIEGVPAEVLAPARAALASELAAHL